MTINICCKFKNPLTFSLHSKISTVVIVGVGDSMPFERIGSIDTPSVALSDVYYIPSLTMKLASVRALGKLDAHDISDCSGCKLAILSVTVHLFIASVHRLHEPESYREVVCDPLWQVAMAEELTALHQTHTYKAHLVSQGYAQEYGMDYEEKFAPVAKMTIVRTLIVVASSCKWKISQLDVKNAFLNGDLNGYFFMTPPLGVSHKLGEGCNLRKALYGLKQAPRACITGDDCVRIKSLKLELAHRFAMKDLGLLRYFLDACHNTHSCSYKVIMEDHTEQISREFSF
ncbi:gag-pol polyprotein [Tanacetum coccineum]